MSHSFQDKISDPLVDTVISKYSGKPGYLLRILEEVQEQNKHKYLPQETLEYISQKTRLPLSQLYSVVTFYAFFNLKPQGDHSIVICRGTACHTRGSRDFLEELAIMLGGEEAFRKGEESFTTKDLKFTVRTVACFGQCALAPVISVDGNIHGHLTRPKLKKIMEQIT
ncbi:MAG: NAD(P)H-dependent oxidoreductase subunit E [Candidatus Omnitrophota bacterium]